MIEYSFEDVEGRTYNLNDSGIQIIARNSLTYSDLKLNYENRIINKTYLPGSHVVGDPRLMSRKLSFDLKRTGDNFETQLNMFIRKAEIAKYLVDDTNSRRMRIVLDSVNVKYEKGSLKKFSDESITFTCLDPFWEEATETSILNESLSAGINDITINNNGYLDTYGRLVFTAATGVSKIQAYTVPGLLELEITEGIEIRDSLFGNGAYTQLELDNYNGTLTLVAGSDEYDRVAYITPGTGFFRFPQGSNTIRIIPDAICEVDIYFRKRYYE